MSFENNWNKPITYIEDKELLELEIASASTAIDLINFKLKQIKEQALGNKSKDECFLKAVFYKTIELRMERDDLIDKYDYFIAKLDKMEV